MLTKLIPSIVAALVLVVNSFSEQISAFVVEHPTLAIIIGAISTILGNLAKSPRDSQ